MIGLGSGISIRGVRFRIERELLLEGRIAALHSLHHSQDHPPSALLYATHIERNGVEFFRLTCEQDLEGIVAKLKHGRYGERWFKIGNPQYSQREGRRELFEKRRGAATQ
jgi:hypothetical protein